MAEESKPKRGLKKVETMRQKTTRGEASPKARRLRSTAKSATIPFVAAKRAAGKHYYVVTPHNAGLKGFLTKPRRWTPGYFRSAFGELREVTWPSRKETWKLVLAVFVFSIAFGLVIAIVDYGLEKLFKKAFL